MSNFLTDAETLVKAARILGNNPALEEEPNEAAIEQLETCARIIDAHEARQDLRNKIIAQAHGRALSILGTSNDDIIAVAVDATLNHLGHEQ